jgi:hypothetical protein
VLPAAVLLRHAAPGVRLLPLEDAIALESAVLTRPDADDVATLAFLDAVTTAPPARARTAASRRALRLAA